MSRSRPIARASRLSKRRLSNLGKNGDSMDPSDYPRMTSSVPNRQASAADVLQTAMMTASE